MQPNTVIPTIVHSSPSLLLFAHRTELILHVLSTAVMSSTPCKPCDLMMPSDEFDAKACGLTANSLKNGLMPINDIDYHLFEHGLYKDLGKPAWSVCFAYPLFGSLVWVVLPSQARSTEGTAKVKPHKCLVTSLSGAVACALQAYLTTTSMILSSRECIQTSLSHLLMSSKPEQRSLQAARDRCTPETLEYAPA